MRDGQLAEKQLKTEYDLKRMAELQVTAAALIPPTFLIHFMWLLSFLCSFLGTLLADDHDWPA